MDLKSTSELQTIPSISSLFRHSRVCVERTYALGIDSCGFAASPATHYKVTPWKTTFSLWTLAP